MTCTQPPARGASARASAAASPPARARRQAAAPRARRSRAGATIPAWFEGGQTPIHIRVPKLRGFKNRFKIEYQVVNVGQISEYAAAGRFGVEGGQRRMAPGDRQCRDARIGRPDRFGREAGEGSRPRRRRRRSSSSRPTLSAQSARKKIEDAGGFVQVLAPEKPEPDADADKTVEVQAREGRLGRCRRDVRTSRRSGRGACPGRGCGRNRRGSAQPVTSGTDGESVAAEAPAKAPRKRSSSKTSSEG